MRDEQKPLLKGGFKVYVCPSVLFNCYSLRSLFEAMKWLWELNMRRILFSRHQNHAAAVEIYHLVQQR
ncbi:hypothetical protein H6F76_29425 [Leptolyngbya sp. FACHB-321]|uniref:hypothetical protein n=1 Tax=Leptolyngbya sp. FACHB-321 TaxID=2692807 RepID=UPI001683D534|nr:hypothetical protein [Leptolyngbya sp. FACHB-321]MBD2039077.1 hypothetical protein [Leptolyngbya sp. FACHB-321]